MSAADLTSAGVPAVDMTAVLERRFQRERLAKEQAEKLLESKSLELFIAKQQVEADRNLFSDVINAIRDGFAILDKDFRLLICNRAFLLHCGMSADQAVSGLALSDALSNLQIGLLLDVQGNHLGFDAIFEVRPEGYAQFEAHCRDGRVFRITVDPPSPSGRQFNLRDITERRRLEKQLEDARKHEALGTMAGGIAHEINTPVQYIMSNLEFMESALQDMIVSTAVPDNLHEICSEIAKSIEDSLAGARQISRIVSAVRLYSHPGNGERLPSDLEALLESILVISRNQWRHVAEVHLEISKDLGLVTIYPDSMKQVFLNLIINSVQAIEEARPRADGSAHRIAVSADRSGNSARIMFEDSGPGVPADKREKIYDMFYTTKAPGAGTGQGLAISRRIVVDEHGGSIDCSDSPLGGARFTICLPLDR